jgi:AcrR family transcriptional regulator
VRQTRAALMAAGRRRFGRDGFAQTSVDDLATEARVTTGALYHHFPTKAALFESVFLEVHTESLLESAQAAANGQGEIDQLARAFDAFLDAVLEPEFQRIVIIDAPAVLGLARYTELDERDAVIGIVGSLKVANAAGTMRVDDPETLARLLIGALTRGAMLIANADDPRRTRDDVSTTMRDLLAGLSP